MKKSSEMTKIKYVKKYFDPSNMEIGREDVYELFPDGSVVLHTSFSNGKKNPASYNNSSEDFILLCEE